MPRPIEDWAAQVSTAPDDVLVGLLEDRYSAPELRDMVRNELFKRKLKPAQISQRSRTIGSAEAAQQFKDKAQDLFGTTAGIAAPIYQGVHQAPVDAAQMLMRAMGTPSGATVAPKPPGLAVPYGGSQGVVGTGTMPPQELAMPTMTASETLREAPAPPSMKISPPHQYDPRRTMMLGDPDAEPAAPATANTGAADFLASLREQTAKPTASPASARVGLQSSPFADEMVGQLKSILQTEPRAPELPLYPDLPQPVFRDRLGPITEKVQARAKELDSDLEKVRPTGKVENEDQLRIGNILAGLASGLHAGFTQEGYTRLGAGGALLSAGIGALGGFANAQKEIRTETKEAQKEKREFELAKNKLAQTVLGIETDLSRAGAEIGSREDMVKHELGVKTRLGQYERDLNYAKEVLANSRHLNSDRVNAIGKLLDYYSTSALRELQAAYYGAAIDENTADAAYKRSQTKVLEKAMRPVGDPLIASAIEKIRGGQAQINETVFSKIREKAKNSARTTGLTGKELAEVLRQEEDRLLAIELGSKKNEGLLADILGRQK